MLYGVARSPPWSISFLDLYNNQFRIEEGVLVCIALSRLRVITLRLPCS